MDKVPRTTGVFFFEEVLQLGYRTIGHHMCWVSKLPLFSYGRDGRGLYTHHLDSLLKVG